MQLGGAAQRTGARVSSHAFGSSQGDGPLLVEVELLAPALRWEWRLLGSLTERHGMRMYLEQPISVSSDSARLSIAVPRAQTPDEAEGIVAMLLETIRRWEAAVTSKAVPLRQRSQRFVSPARRPRSGVGMDRRRE